MLRHSSRHIHHTVASHIEAGLGELGWTDATETPFGAPAAKVVRTPVIYGQRLVERVEAGTVAVTPGNDYEPDLQELGGPLVTASLPFFVDVLQDRAVHASTLAEDVRDILLGRFEFAPRRSIALVDQTLNQPAPGWTLAFEDLEIVTPDAALALAWRVVKVTVEATFLETAF